jgi:hypothetical protein
VAHRRQGVDNGQTVAALGAEGLLERGLLHRRRVQQRAERQRDEHRHQGAGSGAAPAAERQPGVAPLVLGRRPVVAFVARCHVIGHQNLK